MFRPAMIGVVLLIGGFLLYVFKLLTKVMEREIPMFSIEEIFGLEWINQVSWEPARQVLLPLSTTPLAVELCVLGVVFLVISMFRKD